MPGPDAETPLVVSTLMMLASGAILGVLHRDLPQSLRPAAVSWQVATLCLVAGCMTFAAQQHLPVVVTTTVGNGLILLGLTAYWHSLRQFYGYPSTGWILLPAVAGTLGVFVFAQVVPDAFARVLVASLARIAIAANCAWILKAQARTDTALSRRALLVTFVGLMAFVLVRVLYLSTLAMEPDFLMLENISTMSQATTTIGVTLPIVATTVFVLMCSERTRRQWERAASTDYLTGLANRRTLTEAGVARFAARRDSGPFGAIVMIDIDDFKAINDAHGHEVGDAVLKHVATRLSSVTRGDEMLGRFGGEEFVVLLGGITQQQQATASAERMRLEVQKDPFVDGTRRVDVTVSVGVAVAGSEEEDFESLLRRADRALYAAKAGGRNRVKAACHAVDGNAATTEPLAS